MFNELFVSGDMRGMTSARKPWSIALSITAQTMIIGALILTPLIYTEVLPTAMLSTFLVAPPPPAPPPPPAVVKQVKLAQVINVHQMVSPTIVPKTVAIVREEAPVVGANDSEGIAGGTGNVLGGIIGSGPSAPPPPAAPQRVTIGGAVEAASLINKVQPNYPQVAKAAQVSGTVVLHAIISKDGSIEKLQVVSGPSLLMTAAMNAVKQWRYHPTLLNGQAVEVDTTIDVVFSLSA